MRASGIITLTTDFGISDTYVSEMKGVILGINPGARLVDITHEIPPQGISQGAYAIGRSHQAFPVGTVHVVVVDPGVGSSRDALVLTTPSAIFVAPDNGVLTNILDRDAEGDCGAVITLTEGLRAYRLTNPKYWRDPVSATFHGRDVFAPVAARLTLGASQADMGEEVGSLVALPGNRARREGTTITGRVQHVDRFGNLVTNITAGLLPSGDAAVVHFRGRVIRGLSASYAEGDSLLAITGSQGYLEISVRDGSAADSLGAGVGDAVRVQLGD